MSTKNAWYFDHGFWGPHPYYTWRHVYANTILKNDHVLGGEACVWGELIDGNTLGTGLDFILFLNKLIIHRF